MAPYTNIPLSPAELSYLHNSLVQDPPIRPDGRSPIQYRPLVAETDVLPSANGSARICFADGTEAIVGIKAEVEKTRDTAVGSHGILAASGDTKARFDARMTGGTGEGEPASHGKGENAWLEMSIEIPGLRDDDALPVFLSAMLTEALLADGTVRDRLWINSRFHWRLFIDVLLLSQPLSYPLPLLSLTTHLALLSTRLPSLISEKDEDPLFNDDWEASTHLYPRRPEGTASARPPVTLLVISVGPNILFDPSQEELAVADAIVAVSAAQDHESNMQLVAIRTIDPPSRLTAAGNLNDANTSAGASATLSQATVLREQDAGKTVWRPSRGGVSRATIARILKLVLEKGGVGQEVMDGLQGVDV